MREVKIEVAGGSVSVVGNVSAEQEVFLKKRATFVETYCAEKGWPSEISKLTMKQILEIREQPGWQNPE